MMKTAQPETGDHRRKRRRPTFDRPSTWRDLYQGIVDPIIMVEGDIIADRASQVWFVQCDDVVEDLAAATSDPALRRSVLLWRLNTGALRLEAGCLE
jgi:hypothetical protein